MGIDEVGRGPWAGPLVVGAVVLADDASIEGLTDSKKLTAKKRLALDAQIKSTATGWGLGWVSAEEIDEVGLSHALRLATIRAVQAISAPYHQIIIDGTINFLSDTTKGQYVTTLAKADLLIPSVSAASIIAKVARDEYMEQQDLLYPGYGFASHVGYGTARHSAALNELGVTPLHRKSFAPIAKLIGGQVPRGDASVRTSKSVGDVAEQRVAQFLASEGYEVVARNWKTPSCEIDIIAEKGDVRYFVEVKYRRQSAQGGGLAAISPSKVKQMTYAAEVYTQRFPSAKNPQLLAAIADNHDAITLVQIV